MRKTVLMTWLATMAAMPPAAAVVYAQGGNVTTVGQSTKPVPLKSGRVEANGRLACGNEEVLVFAVCRDTGAAATQQGGGATCDGAIVGLCMRR